MNSKQTGYLILIAALGMLFVSSSSDVKQLQSWADATSPAFVGTFLGHIGAVIGAYIGGRITPNHNGEF